MNIKDDPDRFLIDADNLSKNLNIRYVFYLPLVLLAVTIASISSLNFSVSLTFHAKILPVNLQQGKSLDTWKSKTANFNETMIEIQISEAISNIFEKGQGVEVEIRDGSTLIYKNKGEIIQYMFRENYSQNGNIEAIIARKIQNGQIIFFPESLPQDLNTQVNVNKLKVKLPVLLNLMTDHQLSIVTINFFTNNEKNRIQAA